MDLKSVSRSDILLAIIAAAGDRDLCRVFAQKIAFLVADEFEGQLADDFYEFDKYHYGPFSSDVDLDAEMLSDCGCISIIYGAQRRDDLYKIASECDLAQLDLPAPLQQYIEDTVAWAIDMSFAELVRAIYLLYPEYQENSRFEYDEELAMAESIVRGLKDIKAGRTYSSEEIFAELRQGEPA